MRSLMDLWTIPRYFVLREVDVQWRKLVDLKVVQSRTSVSGALSLLAVS